MVSSQFESILKDFEPFFNCTLQPDTNDSCLIKLSNGLRIQMELNAQNYLLIGCRLGVLQMGGFRTQVIQEALKANELSAPFTGSFGYSHKSQNLILFISVDSKDLTAHLIPSLLEPFIAKAQLWAEALERGDIPAITSDTAYRPSSGIFGIKP